MSERSPATSYAPPDARGFFAGAALAGLLFVAAHRLDLALGGRGLPRGRIVELFGPEASGKTTLALHVAASAQRAGGVAAIVDAEHGLDPVWPKSAESISKTCS